MNVMMVRAKVSEENVAEVEAAARAMFSSIERAKPQGVWYAACRLPDGVSFLALLAVADAADNQLLAVNEFGVFQESLKGWLAEPPTLEQLTVLGSYSLF